MKGLSPDLRVDYSKYYDLLLKRRAELLKVDERDRNEIEQRQTTGDAPGDDADNAVIDVDSDYFLTLSDRDRQELIDIRDALEKLHRGTYGACENCRRAIAPRRLDRLPQARLCAECRAEAEDLKPQPGTRARGGTVLPLKKR